VQPYGAVVAASCRIGENCQPEKDEQMTNSKTFTVTETAINNIYDAEQKIASLKGANKQNNEVANSHKMSCYGELISSVAHVKLTKGNFPTNVSKAWRKELKEAAGLNDAAIKRYIEFAAGGLRLIREHIGDIPTQYTPEAVVTDLKAMEIDSENKLAKAINGDSGKSKAERLAEQVIGKWSTKKLPDSGKRVQGDVFKDGLTDEELEEFENRVRELKAARKAYRDTQAAKAAEAEAAKENDTVDSAVEAMLDELGVAS